MLHIILFILKIIGIILLVILGIILLAILAVLFVPVRYKVNAQYPDRPYVDTRVSWLLHLVRCRIIYDKDLTIKAKILFFNLYGHESEKKMKKQAKEAGKTIFDDMEEEKNRDYEKSGSDSSDHKVTNTAGDIDSESAAAAKDRLIKNIANSKTQEQISEKVESQEKENQHVSLEKEILHDSSEKEIHDSSEEEPKYNKPGFFRWIRWICKKAVRKIKHWYHLIYALFTGIAHKTIDLKNTVTTKITSVLETINDPENRELVAFLWSQIKILLRKIRPRRYKIRIHYGFEDPETTGKIAMYAAFAYGLLGIRMDLTPEFNQVILEGNVTLRGHVRVISLLIIALRVYTNRLVKKIIRKKGNTSSKRKKK